MGARPQLDRQKVDDVPLLAEIRGEALDGLGSASEDVHESAAASEHVLVHRVAAAGGQCRIDTAGRRVGAHVLPGPGVRPGGQPSHGDGDDPERVRHLLVRELQELRRRCGAGECDDLRGVHTAAPAAAGLADPARRLVPEDHRAEQVLTRGAGALGDGEAHRGECRSFMGGVADVAVVRSRRVAEYGIDARRLGYRNLRSIEPDRGFRLAALLLRQLTQDPRGVDDGSRRRARERAGEDHLRVLDRLRRKVPVGGVVEESSERERAVGWSAVRATGTALRRHLARDDRSKSQNARSRHGSPQHRASPDRSCDPCRLCAIPASISHRHAPVVSDASDRVRSDLRLGMRRSSPRLPLDAAALRQSRQHETCSRSSSPAGL